jgi:hypothetical protein
MVSEAYTPVNALPINRLPARFSSLSDVTAVPTSGYTSFLKMASNLASAALAVAIVPYAFELAHCSKQQSINKAQSRIQQSKISLKSSE